MSSVARLLIVSADDFGLTPGISRGILEAHQRGIVTSTSVVAVGPAFGAFAGQLRDSGIDVGVHLCAVGADPPLLPAHDIPSLVDDRGRFPRSWPVFVRRALGGRIDPDDLRRELDCQIEAVRSSGVRISHLDSHQHLHLLPSFAEVAFELAATHGIGAIRVPEARRWNARSVGVHVLGRRLRRRVPATLAVPSASEGFDLAGRWDRTQLLAAIRRAATSGAACVELITHPGEAHDPPRSRYDWGYGWSTELEALCSAEVRAAVAESGRRLGAFADLVATSRS
jgi:predicted glycoside hydrolase/deacetylase ChbG (UPF0249 family)